jgi:hypothetical protein
LIYGVISGLVFALVAWGRDAVILAGVSSYFPWAKLVAGGLGCMVIGGLAGWLVSFMDRSQVGLAAWALAAISFGWIASHLPYEGFSLLGGRLDPRFAGLNVYPYVISARVRGVFATIIVTVLLGLGGAYQLSTLDMMHAAYSRVSRWFVLVLPLGLLVVAGIAVDGFVNSPLRAPQAQVVGLIRFVLAAGDRPIDPEVARQMHVGALGGVRDILSPPRGVMLSGYDANSLSTATTDIDLDQGWIRCTVLGDQVSYCANGEQAYRQAFSCLLQLPADPMDACHVGLGSDARAWLEAHAAGIGPEPETAVVGRLGRVAFVRGSGEDGVAFECRFRGTQPINLETCRWLEGG